MTTAAQMVASKRAVVFDLFHTLTSVESSWGGGLPTTSQLLGVTREDWDRQLLEQSRERLMGAKTDPFEIVAGMAWAIDPSIPEVTIREATANRIARFRAAVLDIPDDTVAVLEELKAGGKLLGLITNADVTEVSAWGENRIQHLFNSTIHSCAVGWAKPDREIYELSLRELGVPASAAVFVGDGGSNELEGARRAGMTAVMMTGVINELWPERVAERAAQADYVIDRLSELVPAC